jgi:hypothetical protein
LRLFLNDYYDKMQREKPEDQNISQYAKEQFEHLNNQKQ